MSLTNEEFDAVVKANAHLSNGDLLDTVQAACAEADGDRPFNRIYEWVLARHAEHEAECAKTHELEANSPSSLQGEHNG